MAPRIRVGKDFRRLFLDNLFIYPSMDSNRSYAAHDPAAMQLTIEGKESPKLSQPANICHYSDLFGVSQMRGCLQLA